jgi:uncharacterized membrane protein
MPVSETTQDFKLFGVPLGDFGFFQSLMIPVAAGFLTFFATTFLSIIGVSIYKGITHSRVTLDVSYKYIAFPAGVLVLVVSFFFLMALWVRRKQRGG